MTHKQILLLTELINAKDKTVVLAISRKFQHSEYPTYKKYSSAVMFAVFGSWGS